MGSRPNYGCRRLSRTRDSYVRDRLPPARASEATKWPAAGFVDTEIGCFMKQEVADERHRITSQRRAIYAGRPSRAMDRFRSRRRHAANVRVGPFPILTRLVQRGSLSGTEAVCAPGVLQRQKRPLGRSGCRPCPKQACNAPWLMKLSQAMRCSGTGPGVQMRSHGLFRHP